MTDKASPFPIHVDETIRAVAKLHADHHSAAGPMQRNVEHVTAWVGRPAFLAILSLLVVTWTGGNLAASWAGAHPLDPPPFYWLEGATGLLALYVSVMILVTQRRADQLADRREQLTLQLAIVSDQKLAKLIALFEEARKDSPTLPDRHDAEATAMAIASDPETVLTAIQQSAGAVRPGP